MLPKIRTEALEENYQTPAIPRRHPKLCSWSSCRLQTMGCCCWGCGLLTRARSHCEFSPCELFGQYEVNKQPCSGILVVGRMEYTCWAVVQQLAWWVGFFLTLWRVDGGVIIWRFLVRFWVSVWCFVYFIITSFIFIHEGLCWEFMMVGLILETLAFGKGIVAAIGLLVWLSCTWWFGIFTQQTLAQMISERRMVSACCDNHFRQRKPINNPAACVPPAIPCSSSHPSTKLGVCVAEEAKILE